MQYLVRYMKGLAQDYIDGKITKEMFKRCVNIALEQLGEREQQKEI